LACTKNAASTPTLSVNEESYMPDYRYFATKVIKDNDGNDQIDIQFEPFEVLIIDNDENKVRTIGNKQLLTSNPNLTLDDFFVSVGLK
jgi:hypothetical protein